MVFNLKLESNILSKENIVFSLLFLLHFFPILKYNYISILLILFCVTSIIYFSSSSRLKIRKTSKKIIFANTCFVLIMTATLFYSDNLKEGIRRIDTVLPILILPVIILFLTPKFASIKYKAFKVAFVLANLLFVIFTFLYFLDDSVLHCFYDISEIPYWKRLRYIWKEPFSDLLWCARQNEESFYLIHKSYNSVNLLVANTFILSMLKYSKRIIEQIVLIIVFLIFSIFILYMLSLTGWFLLFTVTPFLIASNFMSFFKISKLFFIFLIALSLFVFFNKSRVLSKVDSFFVEDKLIEGKTFDGIVERKYINLTSIDLIKESFFWGYGIGDVQDKMNTYFKQKNKGLYKKFSKISINSHNYYFHLLLTGGVFLLISFIYLLYTNFSLSIIYRDMYYFSFLVIISTTLFIENTLSRMIGVMTFSLINSLFLKKIIEEKIYNIEGK